MAYINILGSMNSATPKGSPVSKEFGDVYFSAKDGFAETRHVFIEGNNLPARWAGKENFVIAETGFGTGLNFLTTLQLFEEVAKIEQRLDFISFEKFPLSVDEIRQALMPWDFGKNLETLLQNYPLRIEGFHKITLNDNVTLMLIFGDVNETILEVRTPVDFWFLDGFKPSANPEMWSQTVFENMERLSSSGTTFATFTAAGFVKRSLQEAGFEVRKVKGFGTKRDMLVGEKP